MSVTETASAPPPRPGFDSGAAAFHVIAHARRAGWAPLLGLGAIYFVAVALATLALVWVAWPFLSLAFDPAFADSDPDDPAFRSVFLPAFGRFLLAGAGFVLFYLLLYSAMDAALLRWLFGRGARLRFGADALRLVLIAVLWCVMPFALFAAPWALVAVSVAIAAAGQGMAATILLALLCFAAFCAAFAVWIWLAARLAPAAAVSVRDGRLRPFGGWTATAGRFWGALGAYFIVWVLYLGAALGAQLLFQPALAMAGGDVFGAFAVEGGEQPDPAALLEALRSPLVIGAYVASSIVSIVLGFAFQAMLAGTNACIAAPRAA